MKYHQGYSTDIVTDSGKEIHISLAPNPSHLEAVDPVVLGVAKAKLDRDHNNNYDKVAPIIIHGDASISGQGIVYELIQMAQLESYGIGGTIHIVVNNQIGFTTNYYDGRSSTYCTDVAKVTLSPVFHVNGDDVEAVVYATRMAVEFRQAFHKDVFIDLLCYRKYGHNEGDEPRFTQPLLYKAIAKHKDPREIYVARLMEEGIVGEELAKEMEVRFKRLLESKLSDAREETETKVTSFMEGKWRGLAESVEEDFKNSPETGFNKEELLQVAKVLYTVPEGKKFFRKMEKIFGDREDMIES
ncbi:MAG: 2-oxoglutarate dehydrogenase E1 component, partial [Flavobacteriales bacterium]|nr:2-oxoglutarate dehydrogenase E1 component [Flavobacteriales bacterium]